MLDSSDRIARYLQQTGRQELTARQSRRDKHKRNRQSPEAQEARVQAQVARAVLQEQRRRAVLTPNAK